MANVKTEIDKSWIYQIMSLINIKTIVLKITLTITLK